MPSDRASAGAVSFRAEGTGLVGVRSAFEEAQRLHLAVSFGTGFSSFAPFFPY